MHSMLTPTLEPEHLAPERASIQDFESIGPAVTVHKASVGHWLAVFLPDSASSLVQGPCFSSQRGLPGQWERLMTEKQ